MKKTQINVVLSSIALSLFLFLDVAHGGSSELTRVYGVPGTVLIGSTISLKDSQHKGILLECGLIFTTTAIAGQGIVGAATGTGSGTGTRTTGRI